MVLWTIRGHYFRIPLCNNQELCCERTWLVIKCLQRVRGGSCAITCYKSLITNAGLPAYYWQFIASISFSSFCNTTLKGNYNLHRLKELRESSRQTTPQYLTSGNLTAEIRALKLIFHSVYGSRFHYVAFKGFWMRGESQQVRWAALALSEWYIKRPVIL